MEDGKYNGWTNYETWAVSLWLDNDAASYEFSREMAASAFKDARKEKHLTRQEAAGLALSDALKAMHEEGMPEVAGVYSDLLNAALSSVNWYEIARHHIEDVIENEKAA